MERSQLVASKLSAHLEVPPKPGIHSYNLDRRVRFNAQSAHRRPSRVLSWARRLFLLAGLAAIGFYAYTIADQFVYQAYANWAFDQHIAGHDVTFLDYLQRETWLGDLFPAERSPTVPVPSLPQPSAEPRPAPGDMLGKVVIPRLNLSAVVLEGVDDATLRRSAGHVPATALPGAVGNFSIAAHRDTLFRPLKDIQLGDEVEFDTPRGVLHFHVVSTRIVKPTDVSVLAPEGDSRLLTLITCYPFYYIGSAPERFIVKARLDLPDQVATAAGVPSAESGKTVESNKAEAAIAKGSQNQHAAKSRRVTRALPARADATEVPSATTSDTGRLRKWRRVWSWIARGFE